MCFVGGIGQLQPELCELPSFLFFWVGRVLGRRKLGRSRDLTTDLSKLCTVGLVGFQVAIYALRLEIAEKS